MLRLLKHYYDDVHVCSIWHKLQSLFFSGKKHLQHTKEQERVIMLRQPILACKTRKMCYSPLKDTPVTQSIWRMTFSMYVATISCLHWTKKETQFAVYVSYTCNLETTSKSSNWYHSVDPTLLLSLLLNPQ